MSKKTNSQPIDMAAKFLRVFFVVFSSIFIKDEKMDSVHKTIELYADDSGFTKTFAKIRFWDAPFEELEKIVPKEGNIIDLGCGDGMFANFLALTSLARNVLGIELNESRFKEANRGIKNTKFINEDITHVNIPKADAIILTHVLHHLSSFDQQEKLILKCKAKLNKNGKLIIAEANPKFSWKFLITWATDHFLVPILFERKLYSPIFFRRRKDWQALLESLGFSCDIISAEKGKPFTHIILKCQKN